MVRMRRGGVIVLVAWGACALGIGAVLLRADTAGYPAAAASGSATVFGSTVRDRGGAAESAGSDTVRAIDRPQAV
jgi:hypothetical protein